MPDYRVTFRGDLGNLAQFDAAIRNSALSSARAIEQSNQRIASSVGKIGLDAQGVGLLAKNQKTIVDSVNNTFKQSGDVVRKYISDYKTAFDKASGSFIIKPEISEAYEGSFKKAVGNLVAYEEAAARAVASDRRILASRKQLATELASIENIKLATSTSLGQSKANLGKRTLAEDILDSRELQLKDLQQKMKAAPNAGQNNIFQQNIARVKEDIKRLKAEIRSGKNEIKREIQNFQDELDALDAAAASARRSQARREQSIRARNPAYRDMDAALNATPPIQADLARVLRESGELRKNLLAQGLGQGTRYGTPEFQRALADQEAAVSNYTRNLRTNVRTVQGEFRDASGLLNKFTVDLDNNGKVIGRWGGQLGGAGSILRQTVRDFQKVIEWTVATTVVFGTLAAVIGQLQSINELNTALTRFSITAQTTAEETRGLFDDLAQVAFDTATPLKEIVSVADDIALATREAGQSTEEWRGKIIDLTTAVGVFTNLTGRETVQAADQLSSAFKQLQIEPGELITILNKVTAVAGGQANAIAEIVQSISGLAEAARAAGFGVDEQIASVQVLSQVTSKSASEIATAFKNLFGSVSSVGANKILQEFGIEIRDAAGGIRPFLDIYREVADALEKGIIPQNRLPDVLRGIAGGPRRAPDAAALLSNIDRIDEVIEKSAGATNEALIANAQILDSNQAKIVQFQNAVDTVIFKQFGESVRELTEVLTDLGLAFTNAFAGFDPAIANVLIKLGLVTTATLTFLKLGKLIGGGIFGGFITSLKNIATGYGQVAQAAKTAALSVDDANIAARLQSGGLVLPPGTVFAPKAQTAPGFRAGAGAFLKGNAKGLIAGGLAAGATGAALAGGFDTNMLGTILQAGGAVATLVPGLQAVGVAAIIAGTGLQLFAGNTAEVKKNAADLSEEIYNLTQQINAGQEEANNFADRQKEAATEIKKLQAQENLAAEEQQRLNALTAEYVTATLGLATANQQVNATFKELLETIPGVADKYSSLVETIQRSNLGPDNPAIKELSQKIARDILTATGQQIFAGEQIPFGNNFTFAGAVTGTTATRGGGRRVQAQELNLEELIDNPRRLLELFDLNTGQSRFDIPRNELTAGYLQSALAQLPALREQGQIQITDQQLQALTDAIIRLTSEISSTSANTIALAQLRANIQAQSAVGAFTGDELNNANVGANLVEQLVNAQAQAPRGVLEDQRGYLTDIARRSQEVIAEIAALAAEGIAPSNDLLVEQASLVLQLNAQYGDLAEVGDAAFNQGIIQMLQAAGVDQEILNQLAEQYNQTIGETIGISEELAASLVSARTAAAETFADRSLQLTIAENSGEFEKNAAGLATLKARNEEAYQSTLSLIDSIGVLSQESFVELNNSLAQVIGLQGLYIANNDPILTDTEALAQRQGELAQKLIDTAVAAGVNADGIRKITEQVAILTGAINAIPTYKQVRIQIQTVFAGGGGYGYVSAAAAAAGAADKIQDALDGAAQGEKDVADEINKILRDINKLIEGGSGGNIGQLPAAAKKAAAAAYNKPSLLDVPEEILNQSNYRQLINEAIQNARNLQGLVPGESKQNKNDIVELLNGTKRILETRGVGEEYLRRALQELTDQIKRQNDMLAKADTIRRIRIGSGSFAALANVPVNSQSGISFGGNQGPISVELNISGQVLTPAQLEQFANLVAAGLKRQISLS